VVRRAEGDRASGTRWFDQAEPRLPVPPGESEELDEFSGVGGRAPQTDAPNRADPASSGPQHLADGNGGSPPRWAESGDWATGADPERSTTEPDYERLLRIIVDVGIVAFCMVFVFLQLGPSNLLSNTTPAGGDMGAHVWGPAYLRDHLLPHFQLAGWAPDWYDGFPAYQFYMVVPSLLIVVLDLGIQGPLASIPLGIAVGCFVYAALSWSDRRRRLALLAVAVLALCCIGLPYGTAFKLVSVSGVVTLPLSAYLFARLANLRFPGPAVVSVASLVFLFYRGFSIYGGNIASTLAGEFAFSMSLSIALVYLGVVIRGLHTGRHQVLASVLLALTGLCHLIPAFWALTATMIALAVYPRRSQTVRWMGPVLLAGGLLSSFWVAPFFLRRTYLNDMGWEKLPYKNAQGKITFHSWMEHLIPSKDPASDLRFFFILAVLGAGLSIGLRLRFGILLTVLAVSNAVAFVILPQGRLWNARVLPFYYLVVILLAGVAVVEGARLLGQIFNELQHRRGDVGTTFGAATALGVLLVTVFYVALPLGALPWDEKLNENGQLGYAWPSFSPMQFEATPDSFVNSWANWNYSGYENKDSYREYYDVVQTMGRIGDQRGCGMAFWEYQKELDRYGTPMALMLLPYWTDGCIGSMEGLYFEASSTTPFHFLMQTELSQSPSAAQRDMPYGGFDINKGVNHLQLMGVKYYMATTQQAIQAASAHPDLTQIARSGPWVIYEVADSALVTPLTNEPAVIDGISQSQTDWLKEPRDAAGKHFGPSVQWFMDTQRWDVALVADGPAAWQRIKMKNGALEVPITRPVPPAQVTNIVQERDSISFDVDRIGSPVLVKESYFPNWKVDGALGPWRVAPNLMVVVPTKKHVELHYGNTSVEYLAYSLTGLGLVALVVLARRPFRFVDPYPDPDAGFGFGFGGRDSDPGPMYGPFPRPEASDGPFDSWSSGRSPPDPSETGV
jgi:hypothetical protein